MHDLFNENLARVTRRQLFGSARQGIGLAALASLFNVTALAKEAYPDVLTFHTMLRVQNEW